MQSSGSGTSFLERCWTLFFDEAVQGERQRTGVGLLIAPCLSANLFEFTLVDERVTSLCLHVGEKVLTVVCIYDSNTNSESPSILESLEQVHRSASTRDFIVLLRDYSDHLDNDNKTWYSVIERNPSGVQ